MFSDLYSSLNLNHGLGFTLQSRISSLWFLKCFMVDNIIRDIACRLCLKSFDFLVIFRTQTGRDFAGISKTLSMEEDRCSIKDDATQVISIFQFSFLINCFIGINLVLVS